MLLSLDKRSVLSEVFDLQIVSRRPVYDPCRFDWHFLDAEELLSGSNRLSLTLD